MKLTSTLMAIAFVLVAMTDLKSQVSINSDGSAPHASAMLDVKSSNKGLLIPRLTTTQRNALAASAIGGLIVYDTDLNRYFYFDGSGWREGSIGNLWLTGGSDVYLHDSTDNVGIGTSIPDRKLEVNSGGSFKSARLTTSTLGSALEFMSTSATNWSIGDWAEGFFFSTSTDGFSNWTDQFYFSTSKFIPWSSGTKTLGDGTHRWSNVYSTDANFSGDLTGTTANFSGDVGIGTSSPARKLEVNAGGAWRSARISTTTGGGFLEFVGSSSNPDWSIGEWQGTMRIISSTDNFASSTDEYIIGENYLYPNPNNDKTLGTSSNRWSHFYCTDANMYGNVAIGSTFATGYKLSVEGKIICTELRVNDVASWPDYVFSDNYQLMPLKHLQNYINENGHLPNVPAASEVEASGMEVGEMQQLMMEKIEELTLYILKQQEELDKLQEEIDHLRR